MSKLAYTLLAFCGVILCGFPALECVEAELPEPYCSINILPFDEHGWFNNHQQLKQCIQEKPIYTVIEVGSWLGSSTRFIAKQLPPGARLYAIDTWKGSPEENVHMQDPRLPTLFQSFLSNVMHESLEQIIIPLRMDSVEAANAMNVKADLIYLDASHDAASVYRDIMAWYPHLKEGGTFCGDDWIWYSVREGAWRAAAELNLNIVNNESFWRFE